MASSYPQWPMSYPGHRDPVSFPLNGFFTEHQWIVLSIKRAPANKTALESQKLATRTKVYTSAAFSRLAELFLHSAPKTLGLKKLLGSDWESAGLPSATSAFKLTLIPTLYRHAHAHTCAHTRMNTYPQIHIHTLTHDYMHTHTTHMHTNTHARIHAHVQTHRCAYTHSLTRAFTAHFPIKFLNPTLLLKWGLFKLFTRDCRVAMSGISFFHPPTPRATQHTHCKKCRQALSIPPNAQASREAGRATLTL